MDWVEEQNLRRREEERLQSARVRIQATYTKRPCIYRAIVMEYLPQFRKESDRTPFLVLCGESYFGKTAYMKTFVSPTRYKEINCSACQEPALQGVSKENIDLLILDECTPEVVLRQRGLMQSRPEMFTLGCSATNKFTYQVSLFGIMVVITSNLWVKNCERLAEEDLKWIQRNQVLIEVNSFMFE